MRKASTSVINEIVLILSEAARPLSLVDLQHYSKDEAGKFRQYSTMLKVKDDLIESGLVDVSKAGRLILLTLSELGREYVAVLKKTKLVR